MAQSKIYMKVAGIDAIDVGKNQTRTLPFSGSGSLVPRPHPLSSQREGSGDETMGPEEYFV